MNYYFYILQCKDIDRYYGHTDNLVKRLKAHSNGRVESTRNRRPVRLVYFEECDSRREAFRREQQFKYGKTRKTTIERLIRAFDQEKCQGFNSHTQRSNSGED